LAIDDEVARLAVELRISEKARGIVNYCGRAYCVFSTPSDISFLSGVEHGLGIHNCYYEVGSRYRDQHLEIRAYKNSLDEELVEVEALSSSPVKFLRIKRFKKYPVYLERNGIVMLFEKGDWLEHLCRIYESLPRGGRCL